MAATREQLLAITPIDGRYGDKAQDLVPIFSEYGLIKRRVVVEAGWLATLGSGVLPDIEPLGGVAQDFLRMIPDTFGVEDALQVKDIEAQSRHDVKAVELWLKDQLGWTSAFSDYLEKVHFGATSEDINNLAYGMQLRDVRDGIISDKTDEISETLEIIAEDQADLPMLSHTHGQPASPTTLGKEMRVFSERIRNNQRRLASVVIYGKFNGATGNSSAMDFAYPEVDWPQVTGRFVESLGFKVNKTTTQIESHDWMAAFAYEVALGNTIMLDVARDMWQYIAMNYFVQVPKPGETGSSTMPHKVNPIDFENAEANLGVANALLVHLAGKLPVSRLQRDLSDSSAQRAFGEAFGHTQVGQFSLLTGFSRVDVNPKKIAADLKNEWSILTEPVQQVMRRYNIPGAYDIIKEVSRGKEFTKEVYLDLVRGLDIPTDAKARLRRLTPTKYVGLAPQIARQEI